MTQSIQKQVKQRMERRKKHLEKKKEKLEQRVNQLSKKYDQKSKSKHYHDTSSSDSDTYYIVSPSDSDRESSTKRKSSLQKSISKKISKQTRKPSKKDTPESSSSSSTESSEKKPSKHHTIKKEVSRPKSVQKSDHRELKKRYDDGLPPLRSQHSSEFDYPKLPITQVVDAKHLDNFSLSKYLPNNKLPKESYSESTVKTYEPLVPNELNYNSPSITQEEKIAEPTSTKPFRSSLYEKLLEEPIIDIKYNGTVSSDLPVYPKPESLSDSQFVIQESISKPNNETFQEPISEITREPNRETTPDVHNDPSSYYYSQDIEEPKYSAPPELQKVTEPEIEHNNKIEKQPHEDELPVLPKEDSIVVQVEPPVTEKTNEVTAQSILEENKGDSGNGKNFDESLIKHKFKYEYDQDDQEEPEEYYNSKRIEDFILEKGFMILEYFVVGKFCSFILVQLPSICETIMIYINRKQFPIDVSGTTYRKTSLERLKVDKVDQDTHDYENMSLPGFDSSHLLDKMTDTNKQQKNLTYYVHRQISRLLYITQNIEIKPCILLNGIFGFYEMYHMPNRVLSKEFYPVISLEILFSKTFMLEQNIPVFYQKFYSIINQSNRNKVEYLTNSLTSTLNKLRRIKGEMVKLLQKDKDKEKIKSMVKYLDNQYISIESERHSLVDKDVLTHSYQTRRMNEKQAGIERKRQECNMLYTDVKKEYDQDVFDQEITLHEIYYKIRDVEEMIDYLQ